MGGVDVRWHVAGYNYLGQNYAGMVVDQYKKTATSVEVTNPSKAVAFLGGTLPNPRANSDIESIAERADSTARRLATPLFTPNNWMARTMISDRISGAMME